jgi:coenzyme F420-reducing hydrogenase beta subunit
MDKDKEGFFYPVVNKEICINCKVCESVCPYLNSSGNKKYNPEILGAKANEDEIRYKSSSGGIFTLLAEHILNMNGVVFGVELSEDCRFVKHVAVTHVDELQKLRGSKYIQSRIDDIYIQVRNYLNKDTPVLFSGTPCQISGLKLFLKKEYSQLYCVEVICHGVPSEKLWNKYLTYIERKYRKKVKSVSFRSKKYSWEQFGSSLQLGNKGKTIFKFSFEDSFFRMFNSSYSLRPSCYNCTAKGARTMADITIGDFWKLENVFPSFNDHRGVSIILVNNEKGQYLFESIKNRVLLTEAIDYETAVKCNPPIETSIKRSSLRPDFFEDLENLTFKELEK